jgi:uncharacterized protein YfaP (DUF2135 family)
MRRWTGLRATLALATLVVLLFAAVPASASAAGLPATWSRTSAAPIVHRQLPVKTTFTLTAKTTLKRVRFSVSGAGKTLVKVSPSSIAVLRKGAKRTVTVTFKAGAATPVQSFAASITATSGRRAVAKSVKLTIQVREKLPVFTPGAETPLASTSVGPAGGTLTVPAGDTPLSGVQVSVPPGALDKGVSLSLSSESGALQPAVGTYAGAALDLELGKVHEFAQPISITAPWPDTSKVPVPYYIDPSGRLHLAQLLSLDEAGHTFTFQTFHASLYTWIWTSLTTALGAHQTGYAVNTDGMRIQNRGSTFNRNGECFGMTSFSLWYFAGHKADGDFYPRFTKVIGHTSSGGVIIGQNAIATRAFISISQQWNSYWDLVAGQMRLEQDARFLTIVSAIRNTDEPVLVDLRNADKKGGAHSVLAYGYDAPLGTLAVYDPNYPRAPQNISYDAAKSEFAPYAGYDTITFCGDGSLRLTESYQDIYADALTDFRASDRAQIKLSRPTAPGSSTSSRTATISGRVLSGSVKVTRLNIFVGSTPFQVDVPASGAFSKAVDLGVGTNHLTFQTSGPMTHGGLGDVPNTMDATDYTIVCTSPQSIMQATLTWTTGKTDLTLYVTDPTGETAFPGTATTSGGRVDHDVTSGYGPEHFTLLTTDTIQYGQPYTVRVHYNDDYRTGTLPTLYFVTVQVYEGTEREHSVTFPGFLGYDDRSNWPPGSTGLDWADVCDVVLTKDGPVIARVTSRGAAPRGNGPDLPARAVD